jgi:hypothetical protein
MVESADKEAEALLNTIKKTVESGDTRGSVQQGVRGGTNDALQAKYDNAIAVIEHLRDLIKNNADGKKYETALQVIAKLRDLINVNKNDESSKLENALNVIEELRKRVLVSEKIIEKLRGKIVTGNTNESTKGFNLETYIADSVKKFPKDKRVHIESLLKGAASKDDVDKTVESLLTVIGNHQYPTDLPPLQGDPDNVNESGESNKKKTDESGAGKYRAMQESQNSAVRLTGSVLRRTGLK